MNKYITPLIVFVILTSISLLWFFQNKQQLVYEEVPLEKIVIGNVGENSIFNLIANDKGFFKKNGLEAELKEYESGPPAVTDLLVGKVDIAIAANFVGVRNIFVNDNLKILTQVSKQDDFQIIARKSAGVNQPADLKGKKIGVTRKSAGEFFLGRFLAFNNIHLKDIQLVHLTPAEIVQQMESHEIDAAVIFGNHAFTIQKKLESDALPWSAQGGQKFFALAYSTDDFIKNHPRVIEKYLRSLMEAEQYYTKHEAEEKEFIAKTLQYENSYTNYLWPKFTFALGLDQEMLLTMEDQARWVIENKLTEKTKIPNYLKSIYFTGLEKVKPEAVTIIH